MVTRFLGNLKYRAGNKQGLTTGEGGTSVKEKGLSLKHFVGLTPQPHKRKESRNGGRGIRLYDKSRRRD